MNYFMQNFDPLVFCFYKDFRVVALITDCLLFVLFVFIYIVAFHIISVIPKVRSSAYVYVYIYIYIFICK